jgi:hypothetical protein
MNEETSQDSGAVGKGLPQPPALNVSDYQDDLAELELSPDQEREVLMCLWHIVKMVVDAGFGLDAASTVLTAISRQAFEGLPAPDNSATQDERKDA